MVPPFHLPPCPSLCHTVGLSHARWKRGLAILGLLFQSCHVFLPHQLHLFLSLNLDYGSPARLANLVPYAQA